MKSVKIAELKDRLSEHLRAVEQGAEVVVADRNRPIARIVPIGSPIYQAGLDKDDVVISIDGMNTTSAVEVEQAVARRRPGDMLSIVFERRGRRVTSTIRLIADPGVELVTAEEAKQAITPAQKSFRDAWLGSAARNTF